MKIKTIRIPLILILLTIIISSCGAYREPVLGEKLYRTVDYLNALPGSYNLAEASNSKHFDESDPCGCKAKDWQIYKGSYVGRPQICGADGNTYTSSCEAKCNDVFEWKPGRYNKPPPHQGHTTPEPNTSFVNNPPPSFDTPSVRPPRISESNSNYKPTTSHSKPINKPNNKPSTQKKPTKR